MSEFTHIAGIGLTTTAILNLISSVVMQYPSAMPFHQDWYSIWLPSYLVWLTFASLGLGIALFKNMPHKRKR